MISAFVLCFMNIGEMIWAFVLCFIIVGGDDHCICIVFYNCRRR